MVKRAGVVKAEGTVVKTTKVMEAMKAKGKESKLLKSWEGEKRGDEGGDEPGGGGGDGLFGGVRANYGAGGGNDHDGAGRDDGEGGYARPLWLRKLRP